MSAVETVCGRVWSRGARTAALCTALALMCVFNNDAALAVALALIVAAAAGVCIGAAVVARAFH